MNTETNLVRLWLLNDEGLYNHARELAEEYPDRYDLSRALALDMEDMLPDLEAGFASDLLNRAFHSVDFYELAETFLEDDSNE